jgi:glycosyltransferase involved in cell wall biosynthesis
MDVMKNRHHTPDLHYTGRTKQMAMLAAGLPRDRFEVQIGVVGGDGNASATVMADMLHQQGSAVHVLGKPRRFDPRCLWSLRRLLRRFHPDVVHAWSTPCLHCAALVTARSPVPIVANNVLGSSTRGLRGLWESWFLKSPARIIARGQAEADRYVSAGAAAAKIIALAPAVAQFPAPAEPVEHDALLFERGRRFVLCAGSLETQRGFRNAIWTLDILRIIFDDLHLLVLGDGPDRANLERFALRNQLANRVHFLGSRLDVHAFLNRAEMVWVPSLDDCGRSITLEALAAGKPVVASNVPCLREIIHDGETGFLIPPGDKVALGRRTRELLRNPDLASRMGEAGRRQVASFTPARLIKRVAEIYDEVEAGRHRAM